MSGRQDDTRDHPLSCHWRPVDEAFHSLGLPPGKSRAAATTRAQIIAEAFVVGRADPKARISYGRRRAFYAERGRYWPPTAAVRSGSPWSARDIKELADLVVDGVPVNDIAA